MRESKIEAAVRRYAIAQGWVVRKWQDPSKPVPDRLFFCAGKLLIVEFKAPGQTPRPLQQREHDRLRSAGFSVYVIDDIEEGKELIRAWTDRAKGRRS